MSSIYIDKTQIRGTATHLSAILARLLTVASANRIGILLLFMEAASYAVHFNSENFFCFPVCPGIGVPIIR